MGVGGDFRGRKGAGGVGLIYVSGAEVQVVGAKFTAEFEGSILTILFSSLMS